MSSDRCFLVYRPDRSRSVYIQEVEPGSCSFSHSRESAWAFALCIAKAAKASKHREHRHPADAIYFIALGEKPVEIPREKWWHIVTAQPRLDDSVPADPSPAPAEATPAPQATQTLPKVPAGRYAVESDDGTLKFYVVDHGREGTKWEGYVFVSVQASDDRYPVRNRAERERILTAIAADPAGASIRYGVEIGACGVCGRTLTDEDSRAAGIGPTCASKMGW